MCGRFTLRTPTPVLVRTFRVDQSDDALGQWPPRYNVAPTQQVAVVRQTDAGRELTQMRWGLVPFWASDVRIGNRMINARGETLSEKPAYRAAYRKRRCLILADGYFEWERVGNKKQPYWMRLEDDRPFAMAGLWESWHAKEDSEQSDAETAAHGSAPVLSCTIITTDSNSATSHLHDRMPVILDENDWDVWLDLTMDDTHALQPLLCPYESDAMTLDRVSTHVNNARHEGPECVAVQRELF